ncbi:M13 family metallopeptidase [Sinanaerobacter sp. ZZT-01]|uniref:M13 family metallopeptidase n=1 Tax=Sinanaerobacter sp. ZZT-01 TaxID=3111540 RepID=UPI002D78BCF3|nr:M13 family metallopeptidase [Sinanaerobacter sp. ZZT-01]WRR93678.1 M13 family metallopeptidase [Sinanaerobacter sp. ZZT-01]
MKRKQGVVLIFVLVVVFMVTGINLRQFFFHGKVKVDENVIRLEDDYYEYINHDILKEKEVPRDSDSWSYFYQLERNSYEILNKVLKEIVQQRETLSQDSSEQKIAALYLSALDMRGRKNGGFGKLKPYLERIRNASDIPSYLGAIATIYSDIGYCSLIGLQWSEDMEDSSRYACYIKSSDLGLGKENLEDETQTELRIKYQNYIKNIMLEFGFDEKSASQSAKEILDFQRDLAASSLSLSEYNDPDKIYNLYSKKELCDLFTNADMEPFFNVSGLGDLDHYIVAEEKLIKKVNEYCTEDHLSLLKNYSTFCLIHDFAFCLTPEIRDSWLLWTNEKSGIAEKKTDEALASEMVQNILRFEFGKRYVEKCFSEEDKLAIEDMVHKILNEYKTQIQRLDWMGETTKKAAIKKLDCMNLKIGYPDTWPNEYMHAEVLSPENGGLLIDNVISLYQSSFVANSEKVRRPVDKGEWSMAPQRVNAYYNPARNEIVFPAAIIQKPFYDLNADFSTNLGGIGMIIAHEISHAFDSAGSLYDEDGNYNIWWTKQDKDYFRERSKRVVAYYNTQEGFQGRKVNGEQTLDENIADLGALNCITSIVDNHAGNLRKLFEQYAQIWAFKYTDEAMIQRLNMDVHSPAKVRVNAAICSTDAFYTAYPEIRQGDKMYVSPEKRVKIW